MSDVLSGFSFSFAKWDWTVAAGVAALWLAILACAITSIRAQPFGRLQRRCWMLVVILVPILGLLAYLPFSLPRHEPSLRGWIRENRAAQGSAPDSAIS